MSWAAYYVTFLLTYCTGLQLALDKVLVVDGAEAVDPVDTTQAEGLAWLGLGLGLELGLKAGAGIITLLNMWIRGETCRLIDRYLLGGIDTSPSPKPQL